MKRWRTRSLESCPAPLHVPLSNQYTVTQKSREVPCVTTPSTSCTLLPFANPSSLPVPLQHCPFPLLASLPAYSKLEGPQSSHAASKAQVMGCNECSKPEVKSANGSSCNEYRKPVKFVGFPRMTTCRIWCKSEFHVFVEFCSLFLVLVLVL